MSEEAEKPEVSSDDISAPERNTRHIFQTVELWTALCSAGTQKVAWDALAAAVATAGDLLIERTCCVRCRGEWAGDIAPAGVVLVETIEGNPEGWALLICRACWTGGFDNHLRAAVAREFGTGDLIPIHSGGRA